ncbi:Planctomycete cytochrome C [Planctomycetales bacterium 10988]|nr:Planctomycete cytochrome C [Planctomycetales bacterium 10988]
MARPAQVAAEEKFSPAQLTFFEEKVRPLLANHCIDCHGPELQQSSFRVDARDFFIKGGDCGPSIVPGKPDESLLIEAVRYESLEMPPGEPLNEEQITILERWVSMGAPWPVNDAPESPTLGDQVALNKLAKGHWAFQPIQDPEVPQVSHSDWVQTPVDAFVMQTLEERGWEPSPQADPRTLIRRLSYDLLGLPPEPATIEAFEADPSPEHYREIVERYLSSPHFGERWARRWLDVARYADTRDFIAQQDRRYPFAYTYRDYVIEAFNADKPYDQFIREQLAADLLTEDHNDPSLAALGFLTVGPRFRNNSNEQLADRIDVVTRGFLGLTVSCARCHDHKYDPISIEDYYSLHGIFASVEEPEEYPQIPGPEVKPAVAKDFSEKMAAREADMNKWIEELRQTSLDDFNKRAEHYLTAIADYDPRAQRLNAYTSSKGVQSNVFLTFYRNIQGFTNNRRWRNDPILAPLTDVARVGDSGFEARWKRFMSSPQAKNLHPILRQRLIKQPPKTGHDLFAIYGKMFEEAMGPRKNSPAWKIVRDRLEDPESPFFLSVDDALTGISAVQRRERAKLESAIKELNSSHPGAPPRAMTVVEREQPVTPRVFLRGDPARRGDTIDRRYLAVLSDADDKPYQETSGRKELAEAIADEQNPLTSRVVVNRLWAHYFGRGLVETPSDFGLRTPKPTHPELLDWLATSMMESNWSLKHVHRAIVLSNTYQQSSQGDSEKMIADAENKLLWKMNRRRLDVEAMRDSMLDVTGRLDLSIGGRPEPLFEKPFSQRRTIYGMIDRVNLDDFYTIFDFPSPDATNSQRTVTTVPQQALFALNSEFMIDQAKSLVEEMELDAPPTLPERVHYLYRKVYQRMATAEEMDIAERFLNRVDDLPQTTESVWDYGYGEILPDGQVTFTKLPYWNPERKAYQAGAEYPHPSKLGHVAISATAWHPGRDKAHSAILQWTAPREMAVTIGGHFAHTRNAGDGVHASIVAGRGGVLKDWSIFNQQRETIIPRYEVKAGETINFVVDCNAQPSNDRFEWVPVVEEILTATSPGKAAESGKYYPERWLAERDFRGPPPTPLTPWQQYAQALMATNEFMFID